MSTPSQEALMIVVDDNDPLLLSKKKRSATENLQGGSRKKRRRRPSRKDHELQPRGYQIEVLEKAVLQNTIALLRTGTGKTFIAALLVRRFAEQLVTRRGIAVFLAPKVCLVDQQADFISEQLPSLNVGVYHGQKDADINLWSTERWSKEVHSRHVLVMTPAVFFYALESSALRMEEIEVLIFDECHHARKGDWYASIMKTYYHEASLSKKPRIFGMTAVIGGKRIAREISALEAMLDAKVYTVEERPELSEKVPTPIHRTVYYTKPVYDFDMLVKLIAEIHEQYIDEHCLSTAGSQFSDQEASKKRILKMLNKKRDAIAYCLVELGLWCACLAAEYTPKRDRDINMDPVVEKHKADFLQRIITALRKCCHEGAGLNISCENPCDMKLAVQRGYLTPKVSELIVALIRQKSNENIRCIVFATRRVSCIVLSNLIKRLQCLDFLRAEFLTGVNARLSGNRENTLQLFHEGKVNILVATSVAEEGLDVQQCSTVFRFDLCRDLRSYIQSRGRARKPGAEYVMFLEKGNLEDENLLMEMTEKEKEMNHEAFSRIHVDVQQKSLVDEDLEILQLAPGVLISTSGSINLIHRYCAQLPGDRFYNPNPEFQYKQGDQGYACIISFPPNAPLKLFEGLFKKNKQLAKRSVCLEVCKELYNSGTLTVSSIKSLTSSEDGAETSGSGTTKLKELHPSITQCSSLRGRWIFSSTEVTLNFYRLIFTVEPSIKEELVNFAFLVEPRLDDDVCKPELEMPIRKGRVVRAQLSFVERLTLDSQQVATSKLYQEIMFNGAYGRLVFWPDGEDKTHKRCLLTDEDRAKDLWAQTYLLLPLDGDNHIDWATVSSTAAAGKRFIELCVFPPETETQKGTEASLQTDSPPTSDVLHTAGGPMPASALLGHVVLTIHTGKLFCIEEVLCNTNAESLFAENESYEKFFLRKYGRTLQFRSQAFLRVKPTHAVHNNLPSQLASSAKASYSPAEQFIELPAEFCLVLVSKASSIRSLYLVPSFMYRLTALILASEFRMNLTQYTTCAEVSKILEAFTSPRCHEGFSYESLELLGDSVLKFAVSQKMFLVYHNNHEGQLSGRRSRAISNAALRKIAVGRAITDYIRDEPFYPNQWVGAGMYRLRKRKCLCIQNNLVNDLPRPTDFSFYLGKTCGEGHRWMCSKTSADVVESLIGAYFLGGGFHGAEEFMKGIGVDVNFDQSLIQGIQDRSSSLQTEECQSQLWALEERLGYRFQNKALLLEAITHASHPGSSFCYQRLEFLGDAALDVLITEHVFKESPGLPPGTLSDLRSAAVNNGCFSRVAVKHGLHTFLRHDSGVLQGQIDAFVTALSDSNEKTVFGFKVISGPKVLGDMVESIAGAILVDTKFNLEKLWEIMKPLLSPIVTPTNLPLHPIRELQELCALKYLQLKWKVSKEDKVVTAEAVVQAEDLRLVGTSRKLNKTTARKDAAVKMLRALKEHSYLHPKWDSATEEVDWTREETTEEGTGPKQFDSTMEAEILATQSTCVAMEVEKPFIVSSGIVKPPEENESALATHLTIGTEECSMGKPVEEDAALKEELAIPARFKDPGAARTYLHGLCNQKLWIPPKYEELEKGTGSTKTFAVVMAIEIPGEGVVVQQNGIYTSSKKRAKDDAARKMLLKLQAMQLINLT